LSELINALELLQLRGNMLLKVRHLIKNWPLLDSRHW
jgi:hypothetical protein